MLKEPGRLPIKFTKEKIREVINDILANPDKSSEAEGLLDELKYYQSETRKVGWNRVRIISDKNLLIIEYILQALLAEDKMAQLYVYDAIRQYVEEYDCKYGTGIIPKSIPMLKNVVNYWLRQIN